MNEVEEVEDKEIEEPEVVYDIIPEQEETVSDSFFETFEYIFHISARNAIHASAAGRTPSSKYFRSFSR